MNEKSLLLVLSRDKETQNYKPEAHNLSVDEASAHVRKLEAEGIAAAFVAQYGMGRHRASDPRRGKPCKQIAEDFAKMQNQARSGPAQLEEDPASVSNNEPVDE